MSKPGAIKISLGAKKPPKSGPDTKLPTKAGNTAKRATGSKFSFGAGEDDGPEDEEGKSVEVTHFDQARGGAHHEHAQKIAQDSSERVIECAPNRNWRDEAVRRRQKSALPGRNQGSQVVEDDPEGRPEMVYGLNVRNNDSSAEDHRARPAPDASRTAAVDELRAYEDDVEKAPDAPSLSDYDKVPVEGFGLAMLKGMGYKEKEKEKANDDKKGAVEVRRRPALLGIGAKPLEDDKKR